MNNLVILFNDNATLSVSKRYGNPILDVGCNVALSNIVPENNLPYLNTAFFIVRLSELQETLMEKLKEQLKQSGYTVDEKWKSIFFHTYKFAKGGKFV